MPTSVVVMVLGIILITTVGRIYMAKNGLSRQGGRDGRVGLITEQSGREASAMQTEIKTLKDRIAVLERVITDTNSASSLDREIEKLR